MHYRIFNLETLLNHFCELFNACKHSVYIILSLFKFKLYNTLVVGIIKQI